jgi:hypothetical protein
MSSSLDNFGPSEVGGVKFMLEGNPQYLNRLQPVSVCDCTDHSVLYNTDFHLIRISGCVMAKNSL